MTLFKSFDFLLAFFFNFAQMPVTNFKFIR